MRLAVSLTHLGGLAGSGHAGLLPVAVAAEQAGVDQLVLSEHVVLAKEIRGHPDARTGDQPVKFPFPSDEDYPDPLVTLAAIAAVTTRVTLSTNVLLAALRPAVLLAKMAATVDVLSAGRLELGVGVGWHLEESDAIGVPFDGIGARLKDTIGACRTLWRGGPSSFSSKTVAFTDMFCVPTPVRGTIPVWFGGTARPQVARRIVELDDGWTPMGNATLEDVALGVELIRKHCHTVGRDPADIAVRRSLPVGVNLDAAMGRAVEFVEAGATVLQLPPLTRFVGSIGDVGPMLTEAVALLRSELG